MFTISIRNSFTSVSNHWWCSVLLRNCKVLLKVNVDGRNVLILRWSTFQIYKSKYSVLTFLNTNKSTQLNSSINTFQGLGLVRLIGFGIAEHLKSKAIMGKKAAGGFYAVARGREVGIFRTWDECTKQVNGFPNARYKKFPTSEEAQSFVEQHRDTRNFPLSTSAVSKAAVGSTSWPSVSRSVSNLDGKNQTTKNSNHSLTTNFLPSNATTTRKFNTFAPQQKRTLKVTEDRVVNKRLKTDQVASNCHVDLSKFTVDKDGYVVVFTDGACTKNGRKAAKAGIGIWFGHNHPLNISEPVSGRQTNNTAEIQAAEHAITQAKKNGINKLNVKTDSQFTINCVTKWINNWRRNNWKLSSGGDVKNKEDLLNLDEAMKNMEIKWSYVAGHAGIEGNEAADRLAVAGAERSTGF